MHLASMKSLGIIAAVFSLSLGAQLSNAASEVDVVQAQAMNNNGALLLDVREPSEYAEAHAPNAVLIPLGQLAARINEISSYKNRPIAVMCRSGRRLGIATNMLQQAGYSQVSNVRGGIVAWENAGLEEVRNK